MSTLADTVAQINTHTSQVRLATRVVIEVHLSAVLTLPFNRGDTITVDELAHQLHANLVHRLTSQHATLAEHLDSLEVLETRDIASMVPSPDQHIHVITQDDIEQLASRPPVVDLQEPKAIADRAFELGWRAAADWGDSDHLVADIGSPAYLATREQALSERSAA
jgi:hypothetical protein